MKRDGSQENGIGSPLPSNWWGEERLDARSFGGRERILTRFWFGLDPKKVRKLIRPLGEDVRAEHKTLKNSSNACQKKKYQERIEFVSEIF